MRGEKTGQTNIVWFELLKTIPRGMQALFSSMENTAANRTHG
jgi:hypothetical protein